MVIFSHAATPPPLWWKLHLTIGLSLLLGMNQLVPRSQPAQLFKCTARPEAQLSYTHEEHRPGTQKLFELVLNLNAAIEATVRDHPSSPFQPHRHSRGDSAQTFLHHHSTPVVAHRRSSSLGAFFRIEYYQLRPWVHSCTELSLESRPLSLSMLVLSGSRGHALE